MEMAKYEKTCKAVLKENTNACKSGKSRSARTHVPNMGVQVWLITSKQIVPELQEKKVRRSRCKERVRKVRSQVVTYAKSTLGWKILFTKPIEGDLYG